MTNCERLRASVKLRCEVLGQRNRHRQFEWHGEVDSQLCYGTFVVEHRCLKNGSWHDLTSDWFTVGCAQNTFPKSISGSKVSGATGYRFTIDPIDDGTLPTISGTQFGNGNASLD